MVPGLLARGAPQPNVIAPRGVRAPLAAMLKTTNAFAIDVPMRGGQRPGDFARTALTASHRPPHWPPR